jgi:hypothetical protein
MSSRNVPISLEPEFKIELRAVIGGNYDGDTIILLTSDPDGDLDKWLSIHYGPGGLEAFKFKAGHRGLADELLSREDPRLKIYIATYRLTRTDPRDIMRIGKTRRWVPSQKR